MTSAGVPRLSWSRSVPVQTEFPATLTPAPEPTVCRIIEGDNLAALTALRGEMRSRVNLAYLDPPFLTGRQHHRIQRTRNPGTGEHERSQRLAFDDRFGTMNAYLDFIEPRLRLTRDLLSERGSLVVHIDPKTSHYVKVLADEIFGAECFASEIIWRYRRWPSKTKNFQRVHDVLLRYVKNPDVAPCFNQLYEPLAPSTRATWGDRKQRAVTDKNGRRLRSSSTDDVSLGTPMGDVWEIGIIAPVARERTGYPTQKPEALLARLIDSCTQEGDWILDPFMGSGTSLVSAATRGRRAIGIDQSPEALTVARARLTEQGISFADQKLTALCTEQPQLLAAGQ